MSLVFPSFPFLCYIEIVYAAEQLEYWNIGLMKCWSDGILECWIDGSYILSKR